MGNTQSTSSKLAEEGIYFDYPKPVNLIKYLISMIHGNDFTVLDFFAGSATTAQAVLEANRLDDGNGTRNFICVQIQENVKKESSAAKNGFEIISEIAKLRITKECEKYNEGFQVFALASSAFRTWRDYTGGNVAQLKLAFEEHVQNPLVDGWQPAQLLTELLLLEGFPLHSRQEPYAGINVNSIISVSSDFRAHRLFVCLDKKIHNDTVEGLQTGKDDVFVCFDSALSDLQKFKLDDRLKLKTI
jgi:adenine-specific DNA-methyltransferase